MVLADFPIILWFRSGQYVCQRTWDRSPFVLFSDDHKFLCILNEICLTCSVVQCLWKCTFTVQRSLVLLFCHYHVISRLLLLNRISFPFPTQSLSEIPVPKGDRAVHGFSRRWMPKTFICSWRFFIMLSCLITYCDIEPEKALQVRSLHTSCLTDN